MARGCRGVGAGMTEVLARGRRAAIEEMLMIVAARLLPIPLAREPAPVMIATLSLRRSGL